MEHLVIANGIDTNIFKYNPSIKGSIKFIIGFVAANLNDENKALHRLIEAIELLPDVNAYELLLVGNKKEDFNFSFPCTYKIISDADNPQKMSLLYNQMDVLAVTSTLETFPTTLMEASCCGVSVIGFNVGGISEIIIPFNGQLIKPFDVKSFAKGLQHFKENQMEKSLLSRHSIDKFGNNKMVKAYTDLYELKLR